MPDEPPTALAPVGETSPDAFEREYMRGEGAVLYRDKMVAGRKTNAVLALVTALLAFKAISTGALGSLVVGLPLLAAAWVLLGVLRVTVSERTVDVKLGLLGPTIPMEGIESAMAIDYRFGGIGGWGVRRGPEGWMYGILGDSRRAVKIRWRDERGRTRVTYVGTRTAEALAAAIDRGRRALPAGPEPRALEGA
ncbi:MAG: hypothetical protein H6712_23995 [Myxococcales bacterium]|nr:hypothetical protein [Myxococcales bacterium]MCB9716941.1 hypothetical protein [Myxococcales bacterium]